MKKVQAAILTFIYLSISMGATLHLHYCMGKLVGWNLNNPQSHKNSCPNCNISKPISGKQCVKEGKGCCEDQQKQIKLDNDQTVTEASIGIDNPFTSPITQIFSDYSFNNIFSLTEEYPVTNAPPRIQKVSLNILNCVFRI